MTAVSTANNNGGGEYSNMYYLAAPDTGANTISITMSGACSIEAVASSYTGAAQTSPIDAFRYEPANLETGTSYSEALTTSDDNCWVVWGTREYAGRTISSGTNTAFREKVNVIFGAILADSNAAVSPAGSRTLNLTANASANWYSDVLVSFKPAASAAAGGTARRLFMMGM